MIERILDAHEIAIGNCRMLADFAATAAPRVRLFGFAARATVAETAPVLPLH
jgi:hypothetical protein